MPKISTSLAIAFAFHILIIGVVTFLINKRPTPLLASTSSSINVHFGSLKGIGGPKVIAAASKSQTSISSAPLSTSSVLIHRAVGNNNASLEKANNRGESYNFEDLAVSYREPIYPRLAIKRELQGNVRIRVKVSIDGKPIKTDILKSSGHDLLDQAALESVSYWQFQSKDISYFVEKTIIFQLKN